LPTALLQNVPITLKMAHSCDMICHRIFHNHRVMKNTLKAYICLSATNTPFDDDDPDGLVYIATVREHIQLYKEEDLEALASFFIHFQKHPERLWSRRWLTKCT